MMRAGSLRHRVLLQSRKVGQDDQTGESTTTWADAAVVWAAIEPVSGREFIAGQATQNTVTARIVIRYRPGVTASMRAVYRGIAYNIEAVLPDKNSGREYLTLMVSGGLDEG